MKFSTKDVLQIDPEVAIAAANGSASLPQIREVARQFDRARLLDRSIVCARLENSAIESLAFCRSTRQFLRLKSGRLVYSYGVMSHLRCLHPELVWNVYGALFEEMWRLFHQRLMRGQAEITFASRARAA